MSQFLTRSLIELELLPHDNLEPTLTVTEHTEHFLIGPTCNKRLTNADGTTTLFGFGLNPVETSGLLLKGTGIPKAIVVDHMPTEAV